MISDMSIEFTFLMATERSGGNLLTKILDSHNQVCGPTPSHLIRVMSLNRLAYGDFHSDKNWEMLLNDIVDVMSHQLGKWVSSFNVGLLSELVSERSLSEVIKVIYELETSKNNKKKVFIKESHLYKFIPFLLENFPEAKFVYLVRDPRDMALSWKKSYNTHHKGGVMGASEVWKQDQEMGLLNFGYLYDTGRTCLVKYEDILQCPEATIHRICDHLTLEYDPEMLGFYNGKTVRKNAERLSSWSNTTQPLMKNNLGKYKNELSRHEIEYIESFCAEEMKILGYQPDYTIRELDEIRAFAKTTEELVLNRNEVVNKDELDIIENRRKIVKQIFEKPRLV